MKIQKSIMSIAKFQCNVCKQVFSEKKGLLNHKKKKKKCTLNAYSIDEIKNDYDRHACKCCDKGFSSEYNLGRHVWKNPKSKCYISR